MANVSKAQELQYELNRLESWLQSLERIQRLLPAEIRYSDLDDYCEVRRYLEKEVRIKRAMLEMQSGS